MGVPKPRLIKGLTVLGLLVAALPQGSPASANEWRPSFCLREPATLSAANAGSVRGVDCQVTVGTARLQGQEGYLETYRFRDGVRIQVFIGNPETLDFERPHPVRFSIGQGGWLPGQLLEASPALRHACGSGNCIWSTVRDAQGRLVVARRGGS